MATMQSGEHDAIGKVPEITLAFWIIKIAATTLGETAGDTASMTMGLGYLAATAIFVTVLVMLVAGQIVAPRFNRFLYWATIIASTTAGTTLADFADRSLDIGYPGGSLVLLACVLGSLGIWYASLGSVAVHTVRSPRAELFYWITITFSQTLGTALGDWAAATGLGFGGGAAVFGAVLALLIVLYLATTVSRVLLFWAAFILTRPLGATLGDLFDKPVAEGGLAFSRPLATAVLAGFILVCLVILPQRGARPMPEAA